jgi:hypothetical protein
MAYSWAETITLGVTPIKASQFVEIHSNINTERAARALGGYSWSQTPVAGDKVMNTIIAEARTALDQAHTENYCHTNVPACTTHYSSNDTSVGPYCPANYSSYDIVNYTTDYLGVHGGCVAYYASYGV